MKTEEMNGQSNSSGVGMYTVWLWEGLFSVGSTKQKKGGIQDGQEQ